MLGGTRHTSPGMLGKHHSKETREKIGLSNSIAHRGKVHSEKTKAKMSIAHSEDNAWQWKGDNVKYRGLHMWVEKHLGKSDTCEHCKNSGFTSHAIHWANRSGEYLRDLSDWIRLCVSCHWAYDRLKRN